MGLSSFFPIWGELTRSEQDTLEKAAVFRAVKKGALLHNGSADCVGLFVIRSGQLRAFILSDAGREITLYRLFERDLCLFSASCIMRSIQFDITIEAEKDSELWVIPADVYKALMNGSAPVANYTNQVMASRFSEVMWLMEQVLWRSFDSRLASFLLDEASIEGGNSLKITHDKIASHMGTAREVVTRMLSYFQSEGLVALSRGTVELLDEKRLQGMASAKK